jgi:hypothetical protein
LALLVTEGVNLAEQVVQDVPSEHFKIKPIPQNVIALVEAVAQ